MSGLFVGQGFDDDLGRHEKSNEEVELSRGDALRGLSEHDRNEDWEVGLCGILLHIMSDVSNAIPLRIERRVTRVVHSLRMESL